MRALLEPSELTWRLSSGTASVLGLTRAPTAVPPTTAYVMLGDRCANDCAFCAQARSSRASEDALSRVIWPPITGEQAVAAVTDGFARHTIRRVCLQITGGPEAHLSALSAVQAISSVSPVPVCVSIAASTQGEIAQLLSAGAERVTLALDAVTPTLFEHVKKRSWAATWACLQEAANRYPSHIGTHLIAGLGETEEQLVTLASELFRLQVSVGLFAFTPVRGTRMELNAPPALDRYRRVQAALWLLREGLVQREELRFDDCGTLRSLSMERNALAELLRSGEAFRTRGCPDCNRPYYNERPSGAHYNYPRPLTQAEADREVSSLLEMLDFATTGSEGAYGQAHTIV
ncbi:MAG: radical SAM protein [Chloroflexi bacterium]|nr:radical SAM protein [Chloroflexota bacterium]